MGINRDEGAPRRDIFAKARLVMAARGGSQRGRGGHAGCGTKALADPLTTVPIEKPVILDTAAITRTAANIVSYGIRGPGGTVLPAG